MIHIWKLAPPLTFLNEARLQSKVKAFFKENNYEEKVW